jgi:hypothetical protein
MSHSYHKTSSHLCPACNFGPFTRNNYFTGKLLVERDFTDETRFHMEKLRHHQQQLHGWGVVCGLKVKQHPNEKCRDRFVCIEPGSAVDCCGRDIIVLEEACIDIFALPEIKALKDTNDNNAHTLQICIRYRECPTEEIPVLYDDCGCDDTKCAPNRILESYDVGVLVDPPKKQDPFHTPKFEWENSISVAQATDVALHAASQRVYVLGGTGATELSQWSTNPQGLLTTRTFPHEVLAMAPSKDGSRLYVVVAQASASSPRKLHVLDTTQPHLPDFGTPRNIANSGNSDIRLAVAPDGALFLLAEATGELFRGANNLDTSTTAAAPTSVLTIEQNVRGLALSKDGTSAFSLGPTNEIQQVKDLNGTPTEVSPALTFPAVVNPKALAVVKSTGDDMLAVVQDTPAQIHLIKLSTTPSLVRTVPLAHAPVTLVVSTGGHWAYVLEEDAAGSFVQPVSIDRMVLNLPSAGNAFQVGDDSQELELNEAGDRLFIPFLGGPFGGVAILEISEDACSEILWRHLDGCPHCDVPDCIVLATIEGYNVNDVILDQPADPNDPSNVVRIDNRTRQLLPSTQVITDLVKCLLEHGGGGPGTQGQPGLPGNDGEDGEDGEDGAPGEGLEEGLIRIEALSWTHDAHFTSANDVFLAMVERLPPNQPTPALVIGFTGEVDTKTIDGRRVFQVLPQLFSADNAERGIECRCPIRGRTIPVDFDKNADGSIVVNPITKRIEKAKEIAQTDARGVAFLLENPTGQLIRNRKVIDVTVLLRGDFVIATNRKAIDAEFVRGELPTGDRAQGSKFGIQGGLFESWFSFEREE